MPVDLDLVQPAQQMLWSLGEADSAGASLRDRLGEFLPHAGLAWLHEPVDDPVFLAAFWNDRSPDVWLVGPDYEEFWRQARNYAALSSGEVGAFDFGPLAEFLNRLLSGWESAASHAGMEATERAGVRYQNIGSVEGYPEGWWQGYDSIEQVWKYLKPGTVPLGAVPDDRTTGWLLSSQAFPPVPATVSARAGTNRAATTRQQCAETVYAFVLQKAPGASYDEQQRIWNEIWNAVGVTESTGWNQQHALTIADQILNAHLVRAHAVAGASSVYSSRAELPDVERLSSFGGLPVAGILSKAYEKVPVPEGMVSTRLNPDERQSLAVSSMDTVQQILTAVPKQTITPGPLSADPVLYEQGAKAQASDVSRPEVALEEMKQLPGGSIVLRAFSFATSPMSPNVAGLAGELIARFVFRIDDPGKLQELPTLDPVDRIRPGRDERVLRLDFGESIAGTSGITTSGEVLENKTFVGAYIDTRGSNTLVVLRGVSAIIGVSGSVIARESSTIRDCLFAGFIDNRRFEDDFEHVLHIDFGGMTVMGVGGDIIAERGAIIRNCAFIGMFVI